MLILPFVVATSAIADLYFFSPSFCTAIDVNSTCNAHNISGNTLWAPETTACHIYGRKDKFQAECADLHNVDWNVIVEYEDTPQCSVVILYSDEKTAVSASPIEQAIAMYDENGEVGYLPHGLITYMVPGIDDGRLQIFLVVGTPSKVPQPPVGKFRLLSL